MYKKSDQIFNLTAFYSQVLIKVSFKSQTKISWSVGNLSITSIKAVQFENRMIEWAEEKQRQDLEYKQEIADRNRSFLGPDISGNETFVALTPEEMVAYMENLKERRKQKSITSGQQPVDPAAIIKAMKHRKS